jgi:hypothetical protein
MASAFDTLSNATTLEGVVVGAVVATVGSFAAAWHERRVLRREREADAALVFGELLRTLALQIEVMRRAHGRGDPFGPITLRMARGVRREIEIYGRNRERLFLVRDAALRPKASSHVARLTFAVERVLDISDALAAQLPATRPSRSCSKTPPSCRRSSNASPPSPALASPTSIWTSWASARRRRRRKRRR